MKTSPWLIAGIAALSYATAQADDLFREDGPGKSNRNLIIGNSYYEGVQIVGRLPGGKVEISTKGGRHIVDEKQLPPLWSAAMDKREAAKRAEMKAEAEAKLSPEEKAEEELHRKMDRLMGEADEIFSPLPTSNYGKSGGGSIRAFVMGFRKNRSEVLICDGKEAAWVKMSYFTEDSAKSLRETDVEALEAAREKAKKKEEARAEIRKDIREHAAKTWPDDYNMQLVEAERQEKAWDKICHWLHKPPFGITREEGDKIWEKALFRWPHDYCMQVIEVEKQAEALSKLKQQAE